MRRSTSSGVQPFRHGTGSTVRDEVTASEVHQQLQRIVSSDEFARAERLTSFLSYVVERTLAGDGNDLKEYTIGVDVFHRGEDFNPAVTPIVRVEAGRVRERLRRYYQRRGVSDPVLIEIPKGRYAPNFRRREKRGRRPARRRPAPSDPGPRSLSVIPFFDLSPDQEHEYFCAGLTDELVTALTKVRGLRVVAWPSRQPFGRESKGSHRLARQLRVDAVLEGSVRWSGETVRIAAQLIDVADSSYLWSEIYHRSLQDVFAVQEEIALAIVRALRGELLLEASAPLVPRHTDNIEVYNLYLKGRYHCNQRTEEGLRKGAKYFESAIALEAGFAAGYAGLADAHVLLAWHGYEPALEAMPRAETAAQTALELNHNLAEAHTSLALVYELFHWDWATAKRHFVQAGALHPGGGTTLFEYGLFLSRTRRLREGLKCLREAQNLDPFSAVIATNLGVIYYYCRDYDRAQDHLAKALALNPLYPPAHYRAALVLLARGQIEEASAKLAYARDLSSDSPVIIGTLGLCFARMNRRDDACGVLADLLELGSRRYISPVAMALVHWGLGEHDAAFERLDHAYDQRDVLLVDLRIDLLYDHLRDDARFEKLIDRMAFPGTPEGAA